MFLSEGDKAIRALRMSLRWSAQCSHRIVAGHRGTGEGCVVAKTAACHACVDRDYQAALDLAAREIEKGVAP